MTKYKRKPAKCAEVLVPFKVDAVNIKAIYVSNESTKKLWNRPIVIDTA